MKRAIAAVITVSLLGGILLLSRSETPSDTPRNDVSADASPEACVQRMFAAAEDGDVAAYLDCFTGAERRRLERELADQALDVFAESLAQAVGELKAHVVSGPLEEEPAGRVVELVVERIYLSRTERQTYGLEFESGRWRISRVETAQAYQPEKAYGTPVYELPDEGDPQPGGADVPR